MTTRQIKSRNKKSRQIWIDVLDVIFDQMELNEISLSEAARRSGISYSTIRRYYDKDFKYGVRTDAVTKLMGVVDLTFQNFADAGIAIKF